MKRIVLFAVPLLWSFGGISACSDDSFVATNEQLGGGGGKSSGGNSGSAGQTAGGSGGSTADGAAGASGESGAAGQGGSAGAPSECTPGQKQDVGTCEKCGTSRRTCDATGHWGAPACESQGACSPGEKSTEGCGDLCEEKVCNTSCNWDACGLKAGATCLYKNGSNFQCCGADHWQFCSSGSCDWFPCAACQTGSSCFSAC